MSNQRVALSSKTNDNVVSEKQSDVVANGVNTMKASGYRRDILSLRFNQEQDLFACSMDSGLKIFNVNPLAVKASLGKIL